jgi:hypothetical protein
MARSLPLGNPANWKASRSLCINCGNLESDPSHITTCHTNLNWRINLLLKLSRLWQVHHLDFLFLFAIEITQVLVTLIRNSETWLNSLIKNRGNWYTVHGGGVQCRSDGAKKSGQAESLWEEKNEEVTWGLYKSFDWLCLDPGYSVLICTHIINYLSINVSLCVGAPRARWRILVEFLITSPIAALCGILQPIQ